MATRRLLNVALILAFCGRLQATGSWRTIPQNSTAGIGESVVFECARNGLSDGGPSLRWEHNRHTISVGSQVSRGYKDRFIITGDHTVGEFNLNILNVTAEDEGEWLCRYVEANPQVQVAFLNVTESVERSQGNLLVCTPYLITFIIVYGISAWKNLPKEEVATEGFAVTFDCAVHVQDQSSLLPEWYKVTPGHDTLITDSGRSYDECCEVTGNLTKGEVNLRFPSVRLEDEGEWCCRFAELSVDQNKCVQLTVLGKNSTVPTFGAQASPQYSVTWDITPSDVISMVGDPVTFHCKVNVGAGNGLLPEWYKYVQGRPDEVISIGGSSLSERFEISGNSSTGEVNLVINAVSLDDEGTWICKYPTMISGDSDRSAKLVVIDVPVCNKVGGIGPNDETILGEVMKLECNLKGKATKLGQLIWTRDGDDVTKHGKNPQTYRKRVQLSDDGVPLNCRLNHSSIAVPITCKEKISPTVQYAPTVVSSTYCIRRGQKLKIYCNYTPGNPGVTDIRWWLPDNKSSSDPLVIVSVAVGVFNPQYYTCIVNNTFYNGDIGQAKNTTEVHVQYGPMVSTVTYQSVNEGDDIILNCEVDAVPSADEIWWNYPNGSLASSSNYLTINNIQKTYSGNYTCRARNTFCDDIGGFGIGFNVTRVNVKYKPIIANGLQYMKVAAKKNVSVVLTCDVDSNPRTSVNWYNQSNTVILNTSRYVIGQIQGDSNTSYTLTIQPPITSSDYGNYSCRTFNDLGKATFTFILQQEGPPEIVKSIQFIVNESCITITWIPGFDGGQPQHFYVEYCQLSYCDQQILEVVGDTSCTITGLLPKTEYKVVVISQNRLGTTRSKQYVYQTTAGSVSTGYQWWNKPGFVCTSTGSGICICVFIIILILFRKKRRKYKERQMQTQRTTMNGSIYENIRTSIGTDDTSVSDTPYEVIPLGDINPYEDAASTDIFPQQTVSQYTIPVTLTQIEQPYMKPGQRVFEVQRQNTHLTAGGIMDDVFHIIVKAQAWFVDGKDGATTVLVKKAKDHLDKSTNQNIKEEIDFLKSLPIHDNVIRMIACCTNDGGPPFLIMEYAVHGNLKDVLHKDNKSRMHKDSVQNQLLMYVIDVAKGMNHLSNLKVVHRYLAAKHVLVCDGRQCKISNFGYSRGVIESNKMYELLQGRFPYQWMAPEVLSKQSFSVQSDVWSLGVVAWEIFSKGCEPFEGLTEIDVTNRVLNGNTLERPKHCPEDVYLVVSSCWKKEPNERNSFNTIVEELLKLKKKCSKVNNGGVYTL